MPGREGEVKQILAQTLICNQNICIISLRQWRMVRHISIYSLCDSTFFVKKLFNEIWGLTHQICSKQKYSFWRKFENVVGMILNSNKYLMYTNQLCRISSQHMCKVGRDYKYSINYVIVYKEHRWNNNQSSEVVMVEFIEVEYLFFI